MVPNAPQQHQQSIEGLLGTLLHDAEKEACKVVGKCSRAKRDPEGKIVLPTKLYLFPMRRVEIATPITKPSGHRMKSIRLILDRNSFPGGGVFEIYGCPEIELWGEYAIYGHHGLSLGVVIKIEIGSGSFFSRLFGTRLWHVPSRGMIATFGLGTTTEVKSNFTFVMRRRWVNLQLGQGRRSEVVTGKLTGEGVFVFGGKGIDGFLIRSHWVDLVWEQLLGNSEKNGRMKSGEILIYSGGKTSEGASPEKIN
ncbi:hypothetical protein L6452_01424 [Arctium lappa]|uniref:Uncharacterized protein n=1 Tax=Arctium lappa TaxID=4217 RepID=A0ACB9FGL5_ARCLA|nr:hypothetical protein L6452_01424 [Arctium lappa]